MSTEACAKKGKISYPVVLVNQHANVESARNIKYEIRGTKQLKRRIVKIAKTKN
jgi:hypothetical protein